MRVSVVLKAEDIVPGTTGEVGVSPFGPDSLTFCGPWAGVAPPLLLGPTPSI